MTSTSVRAFIKEFRHLLKDDYPSTEVQQFVRLIFSHCLQFSSTDLLLKGDEVLSKDKLDELQRISKRLLNKEPLQYILGETEFYDIKLKVDLNVLIPRPETEELVDWILKDAAVDKTSILDIGTGSGCIALSLKSQLPNSKVEAWDISQGALKIAQQNAEFNKLQVAFNCVDVLNAEPKMDAYTCIVSNPPYVRELEKELMEGNVLDYEPHTALFVSDHDPLIFYRTIAELGKKMLQNNGCLFFEINEYLANEMTSMLEALRYQQVECRKDLQGKDRMMKAVLVS